MSSVARIRRHLRLTAQATLRPPPSPPLLVLFINSICNMRCDHCFYWRALNGRDDLTDDELFALSESLGPIENLNLSGGEPFLRKSFAPIVRKFVSFNGVREVYVPTNGSFTARTVAAVREVLRDRELRLFAVELSLDGMPEFHDRFRGSRHAFARAMETYDALAELQAEDARLRIHAVSTATAVNMEEVRRLTTFLLDRCPRMDHHNLAIIRGDRKNPSLQGPLLSEYEALYEYIRRLWASREEGRHGGIVEPMLQWAKVETIRRARQVVPCAAGRISATVYANGDVSVCEQRRPLGNLRQRTFPELWHSPEAERQRASIAARECHCTTEVSMWSSIVYRPAPLARAFVASRAWRRPLPLALHERVSGAPEDRARDDRVPDDRVPDAPDMSPGPAAAAASPTA